MIFLPGKAFMIIIAAGIKEGSGKKFWGSEFLHPPETRQDAFSELCHRRFSKCENPECLQGIGTETRHRKRNQGQWVLLKNRWIVERTFAWFGGFRFRRLAKDFEILTNTAENMIRIAMIKVTSAKCII